MNFIQIQSWPEIPAIGFFVSVFSSSFNLPDFDIEVMQLTIILWTHADYHFIPISLPSRQDLEEALLLDSSENNSDPSAASRLIPDLIVSLLKGCDLVKWSKITTSNYQMFLRRLFRHKCEVSYANVLWRDQVVVTSCLFSFLGVWNSKSVQ